MRLGLGRAGPHHPPARRRGDEHRDDAAPLRPDPGPAVRQSARDAEGEELIAACTGIGLDHRHALPLARPAHRPLHGDRGRERPDRRRGRRPFARGGGRHDPRAPRRWPPRHRRSPLARPDRARRQPDRGPAGRDRRPRPSSPPPTCAWPPPAPARPNACCRCSPIPAPRSTSTSKRRAFCARRASPPPPRPPQGLLHRGAARVLVTDGGNACADGAQGQPHPHGPSARRSRHPRHRRGRHVHGGAYRGRTARGRPPHAPLPRRCAPPPTMFREISDHDRPPQLFARSRRRRAPAASPIVALESTIITHGMPYPQNVETARRVEAEVRAHGAVPATIAVMGGRIHVGLTEADLAALGQATGRDEALPRRSRGLPRHRAAPGPRPSRPR